MFFLSSLCCSVNQGDQFVSVFRRQIKERWTIYLQFMADSCWRTPLRQFIHIFVCDWMFCSVYKIAHIHNLSHTASSLLNTLPPCVTFIVLQIKVYLISNNHSVFSQALCLQYFKTNLLFFYIYLFSHTISWSSSRWFPLIGDKYRV